MVNPPCFNTYNNISYAQKSLTLQPMRGGNVLAHKQFINKPFFISQHNSVDSDRANYANVPPDDSEETLLMQSSHIIRQSAISSLHQHYNQQQQQNSFNSNSNSLSNKNNFNQQEQQFVSLSTVPPPPSSATNNNLFIDNNDMNISLTNNQQQQESSPSRILPNFSTNHSRSLSQHYYQNNQDSNNYYNLGSVFASPNQSCRSRNHSSSINNEINNNNQLQPQHHQQQQASLGPCCAGSINCGEPLTPTAFNMLSNQQSINQPIISNYQNLPQLNSITIMQICLELSGQLDSSPPIPKSRNYTISSTLSSIDSNNNNNNNNNNLLFRINFPQKRCLKSNFTDPKTNISLSIGNLVKVLHTSESDRTKFTCSLMNNESQQFDLPHKITYLPQLGSLGQQQQQQTTTPNAAQYWN